MIAESICIDLERKLKDKNLTGVVHSVFHKAVNLLIDNNHFITILSNNKPISPNSIRLFNSASFLDYGIERDMKISIHKGYILFEDLNININIDTAHSWDSNPIFSYIPEEKETFLRKLDIIGEYLLRNNTCFPPLFNTLNQHYDGFKSFANKSYNYDEYFHFISRIFLKFIDGFYFKEDQISQLAKGIIGFGKGLTPSMDDFICGLMISNIYLSHYFKNSIEDALEFNTLIVKEVENRTTRVSEEMLKLSSRGKVNEDIRNLMISLISNSSLEEIKINIERVAEFGFSSGTDIISGIYACSIIFNQYT